MTVQSHSSPLTGPETSGPAAGPDLRRCSQCGRVGTRNFTTYPAGDFGGPPLTVCTNKQACRKRWPKPITDDLN